MFSSVQTLFDRFVRVRDNEVPSVCVPLTETVTVLKSKFGCPSTRTSTMSVAVETGGGGGGSGGGSSCGRGGGINSRRTRAYSNSSVLPASSRTSICSTSILLTLVAVAISATKGRGSAF